MAKMGEYLKSLFQNNSKKQNKNETGRLETDAAPVPDDNNKESEDESSFICIESVNNNSNLVREESIVSNLSQTDSIPPLKQHVLAEIANYNGDAGLQLTESNGNQSLSPVLGNPLCNQIAGTVNNTQAQNLIQISNASGVHIGNSYAFNHTITGSAVISETQNQKILLNKPEIKLTKTIVEMMKSTDEIDLRYVKLISQHLDKYRKVARKLKYSEGEITHFEHDHHIHGTEEIIYQILLDWTRNSDDANLGYITKILWKYDNQDLVRDYMKDLYKRIKLENENLVNKK